MGPTQSTFVNSAYEYLFVGLIDFIRVVGIRSSVDQKLGRVFVEKLPRSTNLSDLPEAEAAVAYFVGFMRACH